MKRTLSNLTDDTLLTLAEVLAIVPLSKSTVEKWIPRGAFPLPDKWLGRKRTWYFGTIRRWLESLDSVRTGGRLIRHTA